MLNEKIEEANKSKYADSSSGWFTIKEGMNQIRILTEPEVIFQDYKLGICYHQCGFTGTPKYLARVLDRADNKVKLYKIPFSIFQNLAKFETDDELGFTEFPMPYDIKINASNAGTKEVKYTVIPSVKITPVDAETNEYLAKQKPIKEVIEALQNKNIEKHKADGTWQKNQEQLAKLKDVLEGGQTDDDVDTIEYPDEQIAVDDIPF